jgi:Sulfotransferase domain
VSIANHAARIWKKGTRGIRLRRLTKTTDAFLVSYPKSGRTWFRFILSNYFARVGLRTTDVTLHSMFGILPNFALDNERGIGAFDARITKAGLPLVSVTHLRYQNRYFGAKPVVFLVRDPRDVLVSSYFHATKHKHRFEGSISDFVFDIKQGLPDFVEYLNEWSSNLSTVPHIVLSYEKLLADAESETAGVLQFLRVPVDLTEVKAAVEASRFEAMRDREKVEGIPDHEYDRTDADSMRMRRGKSDGYLDYMSAVDVAAIDAYLAENLSEAAQQVLHNSGVSLHGQS